jgi:predicted DNA-binding transcriptional regulator YafY
MVDTEISRLSRLTSIITVLQTKRITTATELAKKFEISVRTVYRDIRALEKAGIPVFSEEGKGYSLIEDYRLPPVMFTEDEANALITAEKLILKNKDASFAKNYAEAIVKIKSVLKYSSKEKVELLSNRIDFRQNVEKAFTSDHLAVIQSALTHFKLVKLQYSSLEKNEIT